MRGLFLKKRPRDPLISRYPEPMSAERARFEVKRAKGLWRRVPAGHPYAIVPVWVPYWMAKIVGAIHGALQPR